MLDLKSLLFEKKIKYETSDLSHVLDDARYDIRYMIQYSTKVFGALEPLSFSCNNS